jgi:hypothetical protein
MPRLTTSMSHARWWISQGAAGLFLTAADLAWRLVEKSGNTGPAVARGEKAAMSAKRNCVGRLSREKVA